MPAVNHSAYYAARAEKARKLAENARDQAIKKIHEKMADEYEMLFAVAERPGLRHISKM